MRRSCLIIVLSLVTFFAKAQDNKKGIDKVLGEQKIPEVTISDMNGKKVNVADLGKTGKITVFSFWATWCKPCKKELDAINEVYDEWQKETGVKLIAVSIDDARSSANVLPTVNGKGWSYQVLLDVNWDFKRAMNVNNVPHTFIINGNGEIVWQHTSFAEGGELDLINLIRKLNKGEDISETK